VAAAVAPLLALAIGCGLERERPPYWVGSDAGGALSGDGGIDLDPECEGPPAPDTTSLCGQQVVPIVVQKPTLYFLVDVSGSMAEPLVEPDASQAEIEDAPTKLEAGKAALLSLTLEHGHRIHYGLATYPGPDPEDDMMAGCGAGRQAFSVHEGDPLLCLNERGGDVYDAFSRVVRNLEASGGTPLSGTLEALAETIQELPRPASVVLLTDGAPNCNAEASCGPEACIPNLEGGALPSGVCDEEYNCCDSEQVLESDLPFIGVPEASCIDGDASLAVIEAFAADGIRTFVVGVPGSETYAELMESFAAAGGTAREDGMAYYDVRDVDELSASLAAIGAETSYACRVELEQATARPDLLNVYFDAELVAMDEVDGWTVDGAEVTFHGASCIELEAGLVSQVHLISGCPSVVVK